MALDIVLDVTPELTLPPYGGAGFTNAVRTATTRLTRATAALGAVEYQLNYDGTPDTVADLTGVAGFVVDAWFFTAGADPHSVTDRDVLEAIASGHPAVEPSWVGLYRTVDASEILWHVTKHADQLLKVRGEHPGGLVARTADGPVPLRPVTSDELWAALVATR